MNKLDLKKIELKESIKASNAMLNILIDFNTWMLETFKNNSELSSANYSKITKYLNSISKKNPDFYSYATDLYTYDNYSRKLSHNNINNKRYFNYIDLCTLQSVGYYSKIDGIELTFNITNDPYHNKEYSVLNNNLSELINSCKVHLSYLQGSYKSLVTDYKKLLKIESDLKKLSDNLNSINCISKQILNNSDNRHLYISTSSMVDKDLLNDRYLSFNNYLKNVNQLQGLKNNTLFKSNYFNNHYIIKATYKNKQLIINYSDGTIINYSIPPYKD